MMYRLSAFLARSAQRTTSRIAARSLATSASKQVADVCDLHIVTSPFPPIPESPYPPLYEFVTSNWKPHGGYLSDQIAILDGTTGLQRTFEDYYQTTHALASAFQDMDVTEQSTVALYSANHVDYVPMALAVSLCGAKLAPINPLYTQRELKAVLESSRSSVLITHADVLDVALAACKDNAHIKHVIVIDNDDGQVAPAGTIHLDELRKQPHEDITIHKTAGFIHKDTAAHPFLLPYSSGTTGVPKGVCLSHSNIVANLLQCDEIEGLSFPVDHKLISPLPFFHIYGFSVSLLYPAWQGQQVLTQSRFDLETYCRLVQQHRPERTHLVPPILVGLAKHPLVDLYDLSSLRMIIGAAAPIGREVEEAVKQRLGCDVKQGWGMSELSPIGTLNSDFNVRPGSVGPVVSSTVAKVIDESGKSLGPNESGELCIKGPQVMMGYLNDADKTAECLSSVTGWLRSGDVAYYDEDGFFYITDRIKDLIKTRGFQVAPAELEALLLTHDEVSDAAVISVPDEDSGEVPRAFVVLKEPESSTVKEDDIYEFVKKQVAPYKRLDGGVVFTDAIPKSASGKILKRVLKEQVQASE